MDVEPVTVLLVHGDGGLDSEGWKTRLVMATRHLTGWDLLDVPQVTVVAPRYQDVLRNAPHTPALLRTLSQPTQPEALRDFWRRRDGAKQTLDGWLADQDGSFTMIPPIKSIQRLGAWVRFEDADVYYDYKWARRRAMSRVLESAPTEGRVILIGHSLGSVVALSTLTRLPPTVEVPLFLTLGAPLGIEMFSDHLTLEATEDLFPYDRVGVWANVYGLDDPVAQGRGIAAKYPPALDLPLPKGIGHNLTEYVGHPAVVRLLVDAIFGRDQRYAPGFLRSVAQSFTDRISESWPPRRHEDRMDADDLPDSST